MIATSNFITRAPANYPVDLMQCIQQDSVPSPIELVCNWFKTQRIGWFSSSDRVAMWRQVWSSFIGCQFVSDFQFKLCLLMYDVHTGCASDSCLTSDVQSTDLLRRQTTSFPRQSTKSDERSFFSVTGPAAAWNALPASLRLQTVCSSFKKKSNWKRTFSNPRSISSSPITAFYYFYDSCNVGMFFCVMRDISDFLIYITVQYYY